MISGILGALLGATFKVSGNSNSLSRRILQQLLSLNQIFIMPLMSIVPALLYIKMRQLGGESLSSSLTGIEEVEADNSKWKQRMRTRLSLHTPVSQKTTTGG